MVKRLNFLRFFIFSHTSPSYFSYSQIINFPRLNKKVARKIDESDCQKREFLWNRLMIAGIVATFKFYCQNSFICEFQNINQFQSE